MVSQLFFNKIRGMGGLIGIAIDPLTTHECGNQRYLAIPWLDECLNARLPKKASDSLRLMPKQKAWLSPLLGQKAVPLNKFEGDPKKAIWLPSAKIAKAWMQFVQNTNILDSTPPPQPTHLKVQGNVITWEAEADFESGIAYFIIKRDGIKIGQVPENPTNRFGRPLFQGLLYSDTPTLPLMEMSFKDEQAKTGAKSNYRVISVNTVGLESK